MRVRSFSSRKIRSVVVCFLLAGSLTSYAQNCDVDFPGAASRFFSSSCGGSSSNLVLGKNTYIANGDTFTFDSPVNNVSGNLTVNAEGSGKLVIPAGVTVNISGNFHLDQKDPGCRSSNPCTFEIVVNGTLNVGGNFHNDLVTLIWSGSGNVDVSNNFKNTSNGCMGCGTGGCPSFAPGTDCTDDGNGCAGGDFCQTLANPCANDLTKPLISGCPSNRIANITGTGCTQSVTWTAPTASDNCTLSSLTTTHSPGTAFPKGVTTVTYTATDVAGNTSTCSFTVTVNDTVNPVIVNCPSDRAVNITGTGCSQAVSWTPPTASDNCSVTLTSTHAPGSAFPVGTTTVTYTATDPSGNVSNCSFNVTVKDMIPPVFNACSPDIFVTEYDAALQQAKATWTAPAPADNCAVASLTSSASPGDFFPKGTTKVIYTATDASGNSATCEFDIVVDGNNAPFAGDVSLETTSGKPLNVCLTITDADQDMARIFEVINPQHGVISNIDDRCFVYTSEQDFEGTDSFTTIICDDQNPKACSEVDIHIAVHRGEAALQIVKALTPNRDGLNDVWKIIGIEKYPVNKVVVFDRWGSEVFRSAGYDNESIVWDGTRGGSVVPSGTYFYFVEIDDGKFVFRGSLELVN